MKLTLPRSLMLLSIVVIFSVLIVQTAFSQTIKNVPVMSEPARWTQEDVTPAQKFAAAKKELVAAKFEAMNACKLVATAQHASCVTEAESIYNQDLATAQKRFYPSK